MLLQVKEVETDLCLQICCILGPHYSELMVLVTCLMDVSFFSKDGSALK